MQKYSKQVDCITIPLHLVVLLHWQTYSVHAAIALKFNYDMYNPIFISVWSLPKSIRSNHLHQPNIDYDCMIRNGSPTLHQLQCSRGSVAVITEEGSYQVCAPGEERKLWNHGIGLMMIKLLPLIILHCYPLFDWSGECSASVNPLDMFILMILFVSWAGALLLLLNWALCFSLTPHLNSITPN